MQPLNLNDRTPRIPPGVLHRPRGSDWIACPCCRGAGGRRRRGRRGVLSVYRLLLLAVVRHAAGRYPALCIRTLHGMGSARLSLQTVGESGNLHSAFGRIVLQTRQSHAAFRQVHPRNQHDGAAAGRQHADALWTIFCASILREQRCMRRFTLRSAICSAIFWSP